MTPCNSVPSQSILLKPGSFSEALHWAFSCNAYSFRSAFEKAPLQLKPDQNPSCSRILQKRKAFYRIDFQNDGLKNSIIFESTEEIPEAIHGLPLQELTKSDMARELLRILNPVRLLKQSSTLTYILFLCAFTFAAFVARSWLVGRIETDHWLMWGSCDVNCAKAAGSMYFLAVFILALSIVSVLWAPFFYLARRGAALTYSERFSMRVECALLLIVTGMTSYSVIHTSIQTGVVSKYQEVVTKHWNGTLTYDRAPASNENPDSKLRGSDGASGQSAAASNQ